MDLNECETAGDEDDSKPSDSSDGYSSDDSFSSRVTKDKILIGGPALVAAYKRLTIDFPQIFTDSTNAHNPKLVIAIDAALKLSRPINFHFRPLQVLCNVIRALSCAEPNVSNWVVFTSTNSEMADVFPPSRIDPSLRINQCGRYLFPPYVYLGWDQMAPSVPVVSPRNVARFHHVVMYGRPLWSLLMDLATPHEILATAGVKLCKSWQFNPRDTNQALAVLAQRFCLDVRFGQQHAVAYQQSSVADYMRICTDTTENRIWQSTSYPSEPLLSCTASQLLHARPANLKYALECLREQVYKGLIDNDKHGDLVSRLVLLCAKDLCVRKRIGVWFARLRKRNPRGAVFGLAASGAGDEDLLDCQPLPVLGYLEFLFGAAWIDESIKEKFGGWYVNFSHWISMSGELSFGGEHKLSVEECITRLWYRTGAWQCCRSQSGIDKIIPMYKLAEPSTPNPEREATPGPDWVSGTESVSYILISDQARDDAIGHDLDSMTLKDIGARTGNPFVAILFDLRKTSGQFEAYETRDPVEDGSCLRINAPGINANTYPFLTVTPGVEPWLESLLEAPVRQNQRIPDMGFLGDQ